MIQQVNFVHIVNVLFCGGEGGEKIESDEHVNLVHTFNVLFCSGKEEIKT